MTPKVDKREEGLKELARMIAEAYRRRATGKISESLTALKNGEENTISETEIMAYIEPADSHTGYVYTEIIKVDNFIRRKVPQVTNSRNWIVARRIAKNYQNGG